MESMILISETTEIYMIVNHTVLNTLIGLFGLVANVVNIIVFCKQGFQNTMNISLLGLAVSDLCSLLAMLWLTVCVNPWFVRSSLNINSHEILHLTAGIPHICFVRITGYITIFVTAERCLCILLPLQIKQIITPKVTVATVTFIYISLMVSFVPEFQTSYIGWKFYPSRNRSLLGLLFTNNRKSQEGVVFFLYSILGTVSFVAVIILTIILVVQLNQKRKWRKTALADRTRSESVSNRERKSMNMVVMIAVVLIICSTPGVTISMIIFATPDFSILGSQIDAFFIAWSFSFIFDSLNASLNILLYYKMSTKFRQTFRSLFRMSAQTN